ncbi:MAG TPA: OmpA family protein [Candidatus Saccharimonadales bacterium]|nr:OmpA family protein [Candidatus Saccharimonadales bacterium]
MRTVGRILLSIALLSVGMAANVRAQEADVEGSKDHPLLTRMPGYVISRYEDKEFDSHTFYGKNQQELPVEGHCTAIRYSLKPGAKEPSRLQILRNYETALTRIGATLLLSDYDGSSFLKLVKDGKEIWVHVDAYVTSEYGLFVLEKQAMAQDVVADAAAFSNDIKANGHAAVYGIHFDTGRSEIKPESEAALAQIARLLQGEAGLQLNVVGHTDNVGAADANMKLSLARAQAVVQALTGKHGIAAARLKAYGVGSLAPVANNETEEGRAKNRRVELVKP